MLKKSVTKQVLRWVNLQNARFGGHHHVKEYDFRDDPKHNSDIYVDPRDKGWDVESYTTPFSGHADTWQFPQYPENYRFGDIRQNLMPCNKKSDAVCEGAMRAPYWNPEADIAHEYDYESEDFDFQAESFSLQHFKKKGPMFQYLFLGFLPLIFFWNEFIYQHLPDEDYFRFARPPPLEYPDTDDTDDIDTFKDYNSKDGRILRDSGAVGDAWFGIKDNKKFYVPFAGVNQPMEDI